MQSFAIWMLFFGLLPLSYLAFRIFFDWIAHKLLPVRKVLVEFENNDGTTDKVVLAGKTQKEIYTEAIKTLRRRDVSRCR